MCLSPNDRTEVTVPCLRLFVDVVDAVTMTVLVEVAYINEVQETAAA